MAYTKNLTGSPLTFDIKSDLLNRLNQYSKSANIYSLSTIVRESIQNFEFKNFDVPTKDHKQISVRLSETDKKKLIKISRHKCVSIGELLRAALEAFMKSSPKTITSKNKTTPTKKMKKSTFANKPKAVKKSIAIAIQKNSKTAAKPKAVKKAATKSVKKAATKATKKVAAKKAAPKSAKKVATKAVKKAAAKTVKKVAVKKAAVKK